MPFRHRTLESGYKIFYEITTEDNGFEKALIGLEAQIKEAEKQYDVEFLGGPKTEDDNAARAVYLVYQAVILHPREKEERTRLTRKNTIGL